MPWFKRRRKPIESRVGRASRVPEGLWVKCPACAQILYKKNLVANLSVCAKCAFHFRLSAVDRLESLFDDRWVEHDKSLASTDPLKFEDTKPYVARLEAGLASTGLRDAIIVASGQIDGYPAVIAAMEYGFIGGSIPIVIVSCSGGARMMEGTLSLMQMAKINAALARLDRARLPYISVLTDPTTGGVTASFAMLGDLNIAEPKALIGFAGPRVIEQTIRQKLPEGFQRSEFLQEHGMLDAVVDRRELKKTLSRALRFMGANRTVVDTTSQETTALEKGLDESVDTEPDTGPAELSVPGPRKETDSGTNRPNATKKP